MNITAESYGHAVVLNLQGEMVEDSLGALKQAVEHQLSSEGVIDLVLNLEAVPFMDSKVLEYLLVLQESLAERFGQLRLLKPDGNVRKILEVTRLDAVLEICREVTEAVKAITP